MLGLFYGAPVMEGDYRVQVANAAGRRICKFDLRIRSCFRLNPESRSGQAVKSETLSNYFAIAASVSITDLMLIGLTKSKVSFDLPKFHVC